MNRCSIVRAALIAGCALTTLAPTLLRAQDARKPAVNDTPFVKVGVTIFADYTYQQSPKVFDADSNLVHLSQFNVARAYINITGNVSHLLSFRVTPDITRETGTGTSLNGSLDLRLKYAYAQLNLGDWLTKDSWIRLGIQQTPWVDFEESVYRYRFQGPVLSDREGYLSSADAGISARYNLPSNYGDVHFGYYNGETFSRPEANDEKAFQVRATLRPFPHVDGLKGLRAAAFYDADSYVADAERTRFIGALTFEHPRVHAAAQLLRTKDQASGSAPEISGSGYSLWITPRTSMGLEGLLRYDWLEPNTAQDAQHKKRWIAGLAYWLPTIGSATAAFLLDYESVNFDNFAPIQPKQQRISLHALVNF